MTEEQIAVASIDVRINFHSEKPEGIPDGGWLHSVIGGVLQSTLTQLVGVLEGNVPWAWEKGTKPRSLIAQMVVCCLIEQLCKTCQLLNIDREVFMKAVDHGWNSTKFDLASPDDADVGHA